MRFIKALYKIMSESIFSTSGTTDITSSVPALETEGRTNSINSNNEEGNSRPGSRASSPQTITTSIMLKYLTIIQIISRSKHNRILLNMTEFIPNYLVLFHYQVSRLQELLTDPQIKNNAWRESVTDYLLEFNMSVLIIRNFNGINFDWINNHTNIQQYIMSTLELSKESAETGCSILSFECLNDLINAIKILSAYMNLLITTNNENDEDNENEILTGSSSNITTSTSSLGEIPPELEPTIINDGKCYEMKDSDHFDNIFNTLVNCLVSAGDIIYLNQQQQDKEKKEEIQKIINDNHFTSYLLSIVEKPLFCNYNINHSCSCTKQSIERNLSLVFMNLFILRNVMLINKDNLKYIEDNHGIEIIRNFYLLFTSYCLDENIHQFLDKDNKTFTIQDSNCDDFELRFPNQYIFHSKGIHQYFSQAKTDVLLKNMEPTSDYGFSHIRWYKDEFKSYILFQGYSILMSLCFDNSIINGVSKVFIAKPILSMFINIFNTCENDRENNEKYYLNIISKSPILPLLYIYYHKIICNQLPSINQFYYENDIRNVLFSKNFYFWSNDNSKSDEEINNEILKCYNYYPTKDDEMISYKLSTTNEITSLYIRYIYSIRQMTLDFYYILSIPSSKPVKNSKTAADPDKHIAEIQFLLDLISDNYYNEPLIYQILCLLKKELILLPEMIGYNLYKCGWLQYIAKLLNKSNEYKILQYPIRFIVCQLIDIFLAINEKLLELSMFSITSMDCHMFLDVLYSFSFDFQLQRFSLTVVSYLMRVSTNFLTTDDLNSGVNITTLLANNSHYLYTKFMSLITELGGKTFTSEQKHPLLVMLPLIREIITENPKYQQIRQQLFVSFNIFIHLTTILSCFPQQASQIHKDVVYDVLETIFMLIVSNKQTRNQFELEIGYNELYEMLICAEPNEISDSVMKQLLKLTLEKTANNISYCQIVNPNVFKVFVMLIPRTNVTNQLKYIENIAGLLNGEKSTTNISVTSVNMSPPLLDLLIDIYPLLDDSVISLVINVIILIGINTINIGQLKRLFGLMKNEVDEETKEKYRSPNCKLLIDAFYQMLMHCTSSGRFTLGAARYILCNGQNSGIKMKSLYYTPDKQLNDKDGLPSFPQNGYTISMWLNILSYNCPYRDSISNNNNNRNNFMVSGKCSSGKCLYIPYLYNFKDALGNGVECYLLEKEIVIEIFEKKVKNTVIHTQIYLEQNQWNHIIITQMNSKVLHNGNLLIFINDQLKYNNINPYPQLQETIESYFGINNDNNNNNNIFNKPDLQSNHTSINGKFGSIYLLNKCLTTNQINGLYLLGPDYMYTFGNLKTDHIIIPYQNNESSNNIENTNSTALRDISLLCDGSLAKNICIAINGSVYKDNILINNSIKEYNNIIWKDTKYETSLHSIQSFILNGTHCCYTRHISEILDTMGGITAFYPLFSQLDMKDKITKLYNDDEKDNTMIEGINNIHKYKTTVIVTTLLNIIKFKLMNSNNNTNKIVDNYGIEILAFIFENISPKNLSVENLSAIMEIINSTEIPFSIQKKFIRYFLLNMKIWIYTPMELQLQVFSNILSYLSTKSKQELQIFNFNFPFQFFLDLLDKYYYYELDIPKDEDLHIHKSEEIINQERRRGSISSLPIIMSSTSVDSNPLPKTISTTSSKITMEENDKLSLKYYYILNNERKHVYSKRVDGKRPTFEELQLIRFNIIQIMTLLIQSNELIQPDQVFDLYINVIKKNYMKNTDKNHLMEILNLILLLFSEDKKQIDQFAIYSTRYILMDNKNVGDNNEIETYLLPFNGPHAMLSLLNNPNSDVRLTTIQIICMLINRAVEVKNKKYKRLIIPPPSNNDEISFETGTLWDFLGINIKALDDYFTQFGNLLSTYPLSHTTYEALYTSMTGHDRLDESGTIVITQLLKTLYICTCNTSFDVLLLFMTDLRTLLTKNSDADRNREIFLDIPKWQKDLLDFYVKLYNKQTEFDQLNKNENSQNQFNFNQISHWLIDIFTILHLHGLHTLINPNENNGEDGVTIIKDSLSYISELPIEIRSTIYLDTLWNIMQRLLAEEKLRQENKTPLKSLDFIIFYKFVMLMEENIEIPPELSPEYDLNQRWKLSDNIYQVINILSPSILAKLESPSSLSQAKVQPPLNVVSPTEIVLCMNLRVTMSLVEEVSKYLSIEKRDLHNETTILNYASDSIKRLSNHIRDNPILYNNHYIVYNSIIQLNSIITKSNIPPTDVWHNSMKELLNSIFISHRNILSTTIIQYAKDIIPKSIFKKVPEDIKQKSQLLTENCNKIIQSNFEITEWSHHLLLLLQNYYPVLPKQRSLIIIPDKKELIEKREDNINDLYCRNIPITSAKLIPIQDTAEVIILYEIKRIVSDIEDSIKDYTRVNIRWRHLLRELTHERGVWGNNNEENGEENNGEESKQKYYKLNQVYNHSGVKTNITLNMKGVNHSLSSVWDVPSPSSSKSPLLEGERSGNSLSKSEIERREDVIKNTLLEENHLINEIYNETNLLNTKELAELELQQQQQPLKPILKAQKQKEEKTIFKADVEMITPMLVIQGELDLSNNLLIFTRAPIYDTQLYQGQIIPSENNHGVKKQYLLKASKSKMIKLKQIKSIECRRYQLRYVGIEIYLDNEKSYLFNFKTTKLRDTFINRITSLNLKTMNPFLGTNPIEILNKLKLTEKWQKHEISNFDYLMMLNRIAGRTFNDLAQYPVFPWILKDYDSEELDLTNPETYRDLSLPITAQLPEKQQQMREKYELLKQEYDESIRERENELKISKNKMKDLNTEDEINNPTSIPPPQHSAVHYSNPASVIWYLIRIEPFTTYHIYLQDGVFDRPDRQFYNVKDTYDSCIENDSDAKELIPEWFCFSNMFNNINNINLGTTQRGFKIDNVVLPKWAKSAEDFIYKHRLALESEYVSKHLNEWIDLIFGYKQSGVEGEKVYNIYNPFCYEENFDLDKLYLYNKTAFEKISVMVDNFGQCPIKLFKTNHPIRESLVSLPKPIDLPMISRCNFDCNKCLKYSNFYELNEISKDRSYEIVKRIQLYSSSLLFAEFYTSGTDKDTDNNTDEEKNIKLATINDERSLGLFNYINSTANTTTTTTTTIPAAATANSNKFDLSLIKNITIGNPYSPIINIKEPSTIHSQQLFAISKNTNNPKLYTCGHWDLSFKVTNLNTFEYEESYSFHKDIITCISLSEDNKYLITGSRDTNVHIYKINNNNIELLYIISGHDDIIRSVCVCSDLDLVISGSDDGRIIINSIIKGEYIGTIAICEEKNEENSRKSAVHPLRIDWLGILKRNRNILCYCEMDYSLRLYNLKGELLMKIEINDRLYTIKLSEDSEYIVCGGESGRILIFDDDLNEIEHYRKKVEENKDKLYVGYPMLFNDLKFESAIRYISFSKHEKSMVVGLQDGSLNVVCCKNK